MVGDEFQLEPVILVVRVRGEFAELAVTYPIIIVKPNTIVKQETVPEMSGLIFMMKYFALIFFMLVCVAPPQGAMAGLTNCCLPENTLNGVGCSLDGTLYQGDVYYCVEVKELCPYCSIAPDISSAECYQCCAMGVDYCQVGPLSSNSYRMLFLTFLGSCFCCTFLFISAEESRMKEGMTF